MTHLEIYTRDLRQITMMEMGIGILNRALEMTADIYQWEEYRRFAEALKELGEVYDILVGDMPEDHEAELISKID